MEINTYKNSEISIDDFLMQKEESLLYYSDGYLKFLTEFLKEDLNIIVATENAKIVAILPYSIKKSGQLGNVINSTPFYGSNGGIMSQVFNPDLYKLMLNYFDNLAIENNCVASTFITSPFEQNIDWLNNNYSATFQDFRIGQITPLPQVASEVMDIYHSKTRNTVRKALKSLSRIDSEKGLEYLSFIFETHKENISAINGIHKPLSFFDSVVKNFDYNKNLKIYIGFDAHGEPISGLLNLYFNKTVEYFCPVTVSAYRDLQPLSGLIYQAMCDSVEEGYKYWNWGGTWSTQGGVYNFKSRWGTKDLNYFYYTKLYNEDILSVKADLLLKEFPYYFVVPFNKLRNE